MIKIKEFFTTAGLEVPHHRIKLVRHTDHMSRSIRQIIADGIFDRYQAEQHEHIAPFKDCDVILTFIATEGKLAEFHGAYRVGDPREFRKDDFLNLPDYLMIGHEDGKRRIWYDLEELPDFRPLRGRVIAKWSNPLKWHIRKDQELYELRAPGRVMGFPGYQDVVLGFKDLKLICENPDSHADWVAALKFTAAIYRIVDMESGKTYIGSAYGKTGLWSRFCDYAKTGHGGNKVLMGLDYNNFQWSIVRTLSGVISKADVIHIEYLEKKKHGTRAIGLDFN